MRKIFSAIIGLALGALMMPDNAFAHPHIFAQARLELKADTQGNIEELRHVWRFDELFTSTVILEFDENKNNKLDDEEFDTIANTIASSISEYNYFQNIDVGGKDIGLEKVTEMTVSIEDNQLLILFATVPSEKVALKDGPKIGIFDPTFYTAMEFYDERDMVLIDAPENCSHKMVIPDADEAIAQNEQSLTDAFYDPLDTNDMSKILATRMEVSCKK